MPGVSCEVLKVSRRSRYHKRRYRSIFVNVANATDATRDATPRLPFGESASEVGRAIYEIPPCSSTCERLMPGVSCKVSKISRDLIVDFREVSERVSAPTGQRTNTLQRSNGEGPGESWRGGGRGLGRHRAPTEQPWESSELRG
ncbi:uncharacterized protein LOC143900272 isoform X1 [Temnothorax americanus]|uniref:uncharacterized protein LOC143900272 isoform X1 n=1 Tax=Temnothorax americanus TaxID=1964332 RepID=UPI0040689533